MGYQIRKIELAKNVAIYAGDGIPPDGPFDIHAGKGSLYINSLTAEIFVNNGTANEPDWVTIDVTEVAVIPDYNPTLQDHEERIAALENP